MPKQLSSRAIKDLKVVGVSVRILPKAAAIVASLAKHHVWDCYVDVVLLQRESEKEAAPVSCRSQTQPQLPIRPPHHEVRPVAF